MRLALIVEYEGTQYHGFQYQANAPSIQRELELALERFTGEKIRIRGAGRTDASVHARGQVVAFDTGVSHQAATFVSALNFYLQEDIAVKAAYRVPESFDPRRRAISREYRYTILNSSTPSPLERRFSCLVRKTLNVETMDEAARTLVGVHDFASFSGPLQGRWKSTRREVYRAGVVREGARVIFDMEGNAFLPQQVRRTAGALVEVGLGRMSMEGFIDISRRGVRGAMPLTMPPQGLCLMRVNYKDFPPRLEN